MPFGTMIALVGGLILPPDDSSIAVLESNWTWRLLFGFPVIVLGLLTLHLLLVIRTESPKFYLSKDGTAHKALPVIELIYNAPGEDD